jgi:dihydrofolate reductase
MARILIDVSISLDGYVAGPDVSPDQPLGRGGQRLHDWLHDSFGERDQEILQELQGSIGAIVMGRRSYDMFAAGLQVDWPVRVPAFVLTRRSAQPLPTERQITFVSDLNAAIDQAGDAAGDAMVAGHGAEVVQQFLAADLVDEVQLHVVPITLGAGTRLFGGVAARPMQLVRTRTVESTAATHIRFQVVK